jgi:hypothetical protein
MKIKVINVLISADCSAGVKYLTHLLPITLAASSITDELHVSETFLDGLVALRSHILVSLSNHIIEKVFRGCWCSLEVEDGGGRGQGTLEGLRVLHSEPGGKHTSIRTAKNNAWLVSSSILISN